MSEELDKTVIIDPDAGFIPPMFAANASSTDPGWELGGSEEGAIIGGGD